ncbi:MAG: exodeoxyribonuclease III [Patescibacteria group bacterium]|jgi:exodeoxyribonuclease-3|nr:exodeoxyribonuclease III [Patescibacteria group bacterium]
MKIISWNVNGIRAALKKGFREFLEKENPDIICMQEIKIASKDIDPEIFNFSGYSEFWNSAQKPGYSGTAIFIKEELLKKDKDIKVESGFNLKGSDKFDNEGRVQIVELKDKFLINAYFPNSQGDLARLDFKVEFNDLMLKKAKMLEKKKPVIITGDFNVAHKEIDLARPKANEGNAGYTKEERESFTNLINSGFIDTFREVNGDKVQYSWWSFRAAARVRNVGWRIDYFCVSAKLKKSLKNAYILDKIYGSDHAPIGIEIK